MSRNRAPPARRAARSRDRPRSGAGSCARAGSLPATAPRPSPLRPPRAGRAAAGPVRAGDPARRVDQAPERAGRAAGGKPRAGPRRARQRGSPRRRTRAPPGLGSPRRAAASGAPVCRRSTGWPLRAAPSAPPPPDTKSGSRRNWRTSRWRGRPAPGAAPPRAGARARARETSSATLADATTSTSATASSSTSSVARVSPTTSSRSGTSRTLQPWFVCGCSRASALAIARSSASPCRRPVPEASRATPTT